MAPRPSHPLVLSHLALALFLVSSFIATHAAPSFDLIKREELERHLKSLEQIAFSSGGNRAAGTVGYERSVQYVVSQLRQRTDLLVALQNFTFVQWQLLTEPEFAQTFPTPYAFQHGTDYQVLQGSASGKITQATVFSVPSLGCDQTDFTGLPRGSVALVVRGNCSLELKAQLASQAGASAIVITNTKEFGGGVFNGRVGQSLIPAVAMPFWAAGLPSQSAKLSLSTLCSVETKRTMNVLAETPFGNASSTVVVGSHLDSVPAGPGINDNSSGTSFNLALAIAVSETVKDAPHKIRFAWWAGEELGLLGSTYYVNDLKDKGRLQDIAVNFNIDMMASPNYFLGIYAGSTAPEPIRSESARIETMLQQAVNKLGQPNAPAPFTGRSDYGPFIANGVPAGGVTTGSDGIKTMEYRTKFGGFANTPYDPCYHQACDTFENVNLDAMLTLSRALSSVVLNVAMSAPTAPRPHKANLRMFYGSGDHLPVDA